METKQGNIKIRTSMFRFLLDVINFIDTLTTPVISVEKFIFDKDRQERPVKLLKAKFL